MTTVIAAKMTTHGLLIPRRIVKAWGEIDEVGIEQRTDGILIKPKNMLVRYLLPFLLR